MANEKVRSASCLCGAITLKLTGEPALTILCHCQTCQKASGVIFQSNIFIPKAAVTVNDPQSKRREFIDHSCDSGASLARSFCGECGSNLFAMRRAEEEEMMAVVMGIIDGDRGDLQPVAEIFNKTRVGWAPRVEGAKRFDEAPEM